MDVLNPECAAQSVGPANQLFGLLVQTILAAQCAISPKDMWPKDYGPTAVQQGTKIKHHFLAIINNALELQKKEDKNHCVVLTMFHI